MAGTAAAAHPTTTTTTTERARASTTTTTTKARRRALTKQEQTGTKRRLCDLPVLLLLLLLLVMASDAAAGAGPGTHRSISNSMLFLRHIPHPAHDLEGGYHAAAGASGRPGSPLHHQRPHHHGHGPLDAEDKAKPLQGRGALLGRTKMLLRRAMDSVGLTATAPIAATTTATSGAKGGSGSSRHQHTAPLPSAATGFSGVGASAYSSLLAFARWRGAAGSSAGLDSSLSLSASSSSLRPPPMGPYNTRRHPHMHKGLKVGPLLATRSGNDAGDGSALDRIRLSMANMNASAAACPVELVAPCAVPSASLKEQGVMREEGLVVPSSFLVGDVVDFVTRMSKLDRYSSKKTSRSLERIFVTDCGRLVGYVTSMDLLVHENSAPLLSIVRECEVVVKESDEYDDAILAMREKGLTYAPVVDADQVVTGLISPIDMLNEMEMEATDDVSRFSGSGGTESYFGTPLVQLVTARAWWLISLLMLQSLSSIILTHFSALIERHLVIALFLTMLTGTAGNAGNQSSAMVIRGLATGEINRRNGWKVVRRELKAALLMSLLLAAASFVRVYVTPGSTLMSTVAVTVAMGVTVVGACFLGTFAPLLLDRLGLDPCNCASPALATMTDVGGVLILCAISSAMLG